ncbi:hypothetical protein AgCh_026003 [Apium graveolens]
MASFLSGLRQDIQQALYVYKPNTLQGAIMKAKEQDLVNLMKRHTANVFKGQSKGFSNLTLGDKNREGSYSSKILASSDLNKLKDGSMSYPSADGNLTRARFKKITPTEMSQRRELGLCYKCDEQFTLGHRCTEPQLFLIVSEEELGNDELITVEEDVPKDGGLSIHALKHTRGIQTLNLLGALKGVQWIQEVNPLSFDFRKGHKGYVGR